MVGVARLRTRHAHHVSPRCSAGLVVHRQASRASSRDLLALTLPRMKKPTAIVYVDGFNLYRRALDGTPHKWLDLVRMSQLLLHDYDVMKVRYFTANIKHQPHDPQAPQRQQVYLRALRTDPRIVIHLGTFRIDRRDMAVHPLQYDEQGNPRTVRVRKLEEKGSDVNLATHLLVDGFRQAADAFVVVSNDSDLAEPMRVLAGDFGRTVGLVAPAKQPSNVLLSTGPHIMRELRSGVLAASQLPTRLRDEHGWITRPRGW